MSSAAQQKLRASVLGTQTYLRTSNVSHGKAFHTKGLGASLKLESNRAERLASSEIQIVSSFAGQTRVSKNVVSPKQHKILSLPSWHHQSYSRRGPTYSRTTSNTSEHGSGPIVSPTIAIWQRRQTRRYYSILSRDNKQELRGIKIQSRENEYIRSPRSNIPLHERKPQFPSFPQSHLRETANRHIKDRIPDISHIHRPTREELLAAATGFWSRLKVRFKWFSIRSARPFNADEIGAFFSWFLLGHVLWIVLGTTTFFSLAILAVNTVFAQETLARWVGNYLTKSSGISVVFESAIVPKWGDGVITFKNVFVSRRPGQGAGKVSKGSPPAEAAAAAAAVVAETEKYNRPGEYPLFSHRDANQSSIQNRNEEDDQDANYSQFDLSLDTVNVTLSFAKWFNSKGLLQDVEIKGVRGIIDRTSVRYPDHHVNPKTYKHEHHPGDFEIDSFKLEDLLVTVHQPHGFRPFSISIYSCDLPQLRKQWLFYDFLSANTMSGSVDESLFTIHPRQIHGHFGNQCIGQEANSQNSAWKKHSRLRIDGLSIDHLNRGIEGPFSWIHEGNVDIVADVMLPADTDESIRKIMSDFYERMEATMMSSPRLQGESQPPNGNNVSASNKDRTHTSPDRQESLEDKGVIIMDLRVHLNDVRAAVPIFTKDLSYVNNALIRPIVAYINSRKTLIPINCRVVKRASEFDGSWTIFDSGLMDDLSAEVSLIVNSAVAHANSRQAYEAFARDVTDDQARLRRFKKVGLWSLQLAVQAFFMGLAGNFA
ncbi:Mitochondrial distribution and morphology protein 31, mitochondrial precursor [Lecanora helva]